MSRCYWTSVSEAVMPLAVKRCISSIVGFFLPLFVRFDVINACVTYLLRSSCDFVIHK